MSKEVFMKSRRCFAIFPNGLLVWCPQNKASMKCRDWLAEDYNISEDEYDVTVHGSIHKDGHVVIAHGSDYKPVDIGAIQELNMHDIVQHACSYSGLEQVEMYNGVNVGEIGERWAPIENLGFFKP